MEAGAKFHASIAQCTLSTITPTTVTMAESRHQIAAVPSALIERLDLQIMPNPVRQEATIRFYLPTKTIAHIRVFDADGKLLATQSSTMIQGWHTTTLAANQLPLGIYYINLVTDEDGVTKKIVVVE